MTLQLEQMRLDPYDSRTLPIVNLIYSDRIEAAPPPTLEISIKALNFGDSHHYVLHDDNGPEQVIAVASLMPSETAEKEMYLNELVVAGGWRGRGLGRIMLATLEGIASTKYNSNTLALEPTDDSRAFYARHGYIPHPRVPTDVMKRLGTVPERAIVDIRGASL